MKFIINLTNNEYNTIKNIVENHNDIPVPKSFNTKEFTEAENVKISYGPMTIETDKKNTLSVELEEGAACKVIMAAFIFIDNITAATKSFIEKLMAFNPKKDVKPKVEYIYANGDRKMSIDNIDESVELKPMGYKGSLVAKEYAIVGEPIDDENIQIALFANGGYEFAKIANSKNKQLIRRATTEVIAHLYRELRKKYGTNTLDWSEEDFDAFVDSHYNG